MLNLEPIRILSVEGTRSFEQHQIIVLLEQSAVKDERWLFLIKHDPQFEVFRDERSFEQFDSK